MDLCWLPTSRARWCNMDGLDIDLCIDSKAFITLFFCLLFLVLQNTYSFQGISFFWLFIVWKSGVWFRGIINSFSSQSVTWTSAYFCLGRCKQRPLLVSTEYNIIRRQSYLISGMALILYAPALHIYEPLDKVLLMP
jgi:hypothetical protein